MSVAPNHQPRRARQGQAALYRLAVDEGRRAIDDQISELDSMRQRSVQFLAFIGTATAFLVGTSVTANSIRTITFYVLTATGTLLALATVLLLRSILSAPEHWLRSAPLEWELRLKAGVLTRWINPELHPPTEEDLLQAVALKYQEMAERNDPKLDLVRSRYRRYLTAGFAELLVWALAAWFYG